MVDPDSIWDLFLGKTVKDLKKLDFSLTCKNTDEVSNVLKFCHDYRVPVFTRLDQGMGDSSILKSDGMGYCLNLDLSQLNNVKDVDLNEGTVSVDVGVELNDLNGDVQEKGSNGTSFSALDLFLDQLGYKLNDRSTRLVAGKFSKDKIVEITAVLPGGEVTTVKRNDGNESTCQLFELLTSGDNQFGVITQLKLTLSKSSDVEQDKLIVFGFKDLKDYNSVAGEIHSKFPDLKIGFVDCNGELPSSTLNSQFGSFTSFGFIKVQNNNIYSKLFKNISSYNSSDFQTFVVDQQSFRNESSRTESQSRSTLNQAYYTNKISESAPSSSTSNKSSLLLTDDFFNKDIIRYVKTDFLNTWPRVNENDKGGNTNDDIQRRIKLALDPTKILNPNVGIQVYVDN
ncbi:unnamed protein product [Ambrosiozyma monospora]|uniref:Unnamed protein product n=1 Tax=Ambrosiozyma monospora TaxID=43982 RepID=A0A9W6YZT4_AMBMO|nr:unnamed protein product [Ambrosiozyma monospora]